jgi:5-methylcytosine-specific restriction endonuclease McrA
MGNKKLEWQQRKRKQFKEQHGYCLETHYDNNGLRQQVLERDNYKCVVCGMTAEEHIKKWKRGITVDHINRIHSDNRIENMQTMCLSCHGRKDLKPELRERKVVNKIFEIMWLRIWGFTYEDIADYFGFSTASVWKWSKIFDQWYEDYQLGKGMFEDVKCIS